MSIGDGSFDSPISPVGKRFQHATPSPFHFYDRDEQEPDSEKQDAHDQSESHDPWEQQSEDYFNDFLAIDEQAIARGLSVSEEKKRFDKKYRESKKEKQLEQQTQALSEAFQDIHISADEIQEMVFCLQEGMASMYQLVKQLCPVVHPYFEIFSYHSLSILKAGGFKDDILTHLAFLKYFADRETMGLGGGGYLYMQMFLFYLDIPMSTREMSRHVEKYLSSPHQLRQLFQQLLRYFKLNARCFHGIEITLKERSRKVLPYFLGKIHRGQLDLSKRLAFRNLENQIRTLKNRMISTYKQLKHLASSGQGIAIFLGEKSDLFQKWLEVEYNICCSLILFHLSQHGYPLPIQQMKTRMCNIGIRVEHPVIESRFRGFTLEELEHLVTEMQTSTEVLPTSFANPVTRLDTRDRVGLENNELEAIEKWIRFKEAQMLEMHNFLADTHRSYSQSLLNLYL